MLFRSCLFPSHDRKKRKISESLQGRIVSVETRRKISENHAAKKETGKFYQSQEYKQKMSDACKGKKRTPEQREKYKRAALNRWGHENEHGKIFRFISTDCI